MSLNLCFTERTTGAEFETELPGQAFKNLTGLNGKWFPERESKGL